jgi:predicted negative regulator of RcsB-dependent stress response
VDGLLTEQEQVEAIRGWWRENGRYIISGLVIGAGLLFGWNYWQNQQEQKALEASALYESLAEDVAQTRLEPAQAKAAEILDNYASTPYAPQARLAMARLYMDMGRDRDAAEALRPLVEEGGDSEAAMIARLRLGKLLLYQDKPEEVVELLQGYDDTAFGARYSETLGDALAALDRNDEAVEAYAAALAGNPDLPTVDTTLIQMKINNLRVAPAAEETALPEAAGDTEGGAEAVLEPAEDAAAGETGE